MFDIITDSACDLTPETAATLNIEIIPFYVSLDGEHYRKEGKEIAVRDFYQFMVDNPSAYPKTSLPSLEDFETAFRAHAEAGRPVLCICFTSKMSGCVGSARNARELVLEDFPDAKIEVIDSTAATVTESIVVENAVAMRDAGCTLDEAVTWLEAEKITNQIFFTVGNLDYLIKGGRIGKVTGRAANILGIKPSAQQLVHDDLANQDQKPGAAKADGDIRTRHDVPESVMMRVRKQSLQHRHQHDDDT